MQEDVNEKDEKVNASRMDGNLEITLCHHPTIEIVHDDGAKPCSALLRLLHGHVLSIQRVNMWQHMRDKRSEQRHWIQQNRILRNRKLVNMLPPRS